MAKVKTQRALSADQERLRIEGLRTLARTITRRSLAPSPPSASPTLGQRVDGKQRERAGGGERVLPQRVSPSLQDARAPSTQGVTNSTRFSSHVGVNVAARSIWR